MALLLTNKLMCVYLNHGQEWGFLAFFISDHQKQLPNTKLVIQSVMDEGAVLNRFLVIGSTWLEVNQVWYPKRQTQQWEIPEN